MARVHGENTQYSFFGTLILKETLSFGKHNTLLFQPHLDFAPDKLMTPFETLVIKYGLSLGGEVRATFGSTVDTILSGHSRASYERADTDPKCSISFS